MNVFIYLLLAIAALTMLCTYVSLLTFACLTLLPKRYRISVEYEQIASLLPYIRVDLRCTLDSLQRNVKVRCVNMPLLLKQALPRNVTYSIHIRPF